NQSHEEEEEEEEEEEGKKSREAQKNIIILAVAGGGGFLVSTATAGFAGEVLDFIYLCLVVHVSWGLEKKKDVCSGRRKVDRDDT
ncbi:MAG: hypothetical protein Q9210_006597, partial [Variospora velana]